VGSVASSPPLEGTFGAAEGMVGRLDPLRQMMHENAVRRSMPQPTVAGRVGPMQWHTPLPYDPDRDRTSECDADYIHEPDALVRRAAHHRGEYVTDRTFPTWTLDASSIALIEDAVAFLGRERERLTPRHAPLSGLPQIPQVLTASPGTWSDLDLVRRGIRSTGSSYDSVSPPRGRVHIDQRFIGRELTEAEAQRGETRLRCSFDEMHLPRVALLITLSRPLSNPSSTS